MADQEFAPPAIAFGARWPSNSLSVRDQALESAALFPDHPAIEEAGRVTTYAELADQSAKIGAWLLAHSGRSEGAEAIIAVVGGRSSDLIVSLLAAWRAGCAYLPIASDYPIDRVRYLLSDSAPAAILVDRATTEPELVDELMALPNAICIQDAMAGGAELGDDGLDPTIAFHSMAYVIYTSGSTGNPKGAILTHRNVQNFVASHLFDIGLTTLDRQGWSGNVSFDASVSDIWPALSEGATLCVAPPRANENLRILLGWLKDERITGTLIPTAVINMLFGLEDEWWHDLSMRALVTGGDRLARRPPHGLPFTFFNAYGPTECTVWTTLQRPRTVPFRGGLAAPAIGYPVANTFVTILDENLRQCVIGQQGELCIGGAGVGRGYLNRPELTSQKFIHDYWGDMAGNGLVYRTGDQAVMRSNGSLQFVGRSDRQIALQGFRIEAGEVESVLMTDPAIKEAVAKRHDYAGLGPRLLAFITLNEGVTTDNLIEEIRSRMRETVPAYMVPNQFVVLPEMPMTPNGKVDENALVPPSRSREALVREGLLSSKFEPAATVEEQRICAVFADVLALDVVGVNDSFFDIGGDSLAGVAAMAIIENSFQVELAIDALNLTPTPRLLGASLSADTPAAGPISRDWDAESKLELRTFEARTPPADAAVLVTGAGGFVGTELVKALLKSGPDVRVNAMVRSERSGANLREAAGAAVGGDAAARLNVLIGDLREPDLGLPGDVLRSLNNGTRAILHAGAEVNHFKTYEALRSANVEATSTMARIANQAGGGTVPLIYISSISVDGDASDDVMTNGYARGKWVSERRLEAAGAHGLPVRIVRLGRATPALDGGAFNQRDTLLIFFAACLAIGKTPRWAFAEGGHPIDVAAAAIAELTLAPSPEPGLRVVYPPMSPWSSGAFLAALDHAFELERVEWDEWVAALREDGSLASQRALALVSANAGEDLTVDNVQEVADHLATLNNMLPTSWPGFDDAYYRATAAELQAETSPG